MRSLLGRFHRPFARSAEEQLLLLNNLGDGSTLSLDFTTGVLDPRLSFTRSTSGTYIGADGLVKTATANTARFDYDPTAIGTPRGLLIEGSANNLARYSETLETTGGFWGYNAATRTVESSDVNPTGGTGSISFGPTTNGGSRYCGLFLTGQTTTVAYTYSVWVKAKGTSSLVVTIQNSAGAVNSNARIISQPSGANASFTGSGGGFPQINNLSSTGWTKIELTTTGTLGGTGALNVFMYPNNTSTQTTADTVFAWGAQIESGSGASSYIPTGASQGNRAADKMSMTDISTMQWNQTAGTFALHMDVAAETNTSSFPAFMGMYTATPVRVVRFLLNNSSGTNPRIGNDTWTATPTQILASLVTRSTASTAFKFAVSLSNTGQTVNQVVNAGSATTTSGTGTMQIPTRVLWHQDPSSGDSEYFPIHIRSLKYWPTALPTAQLQSITT